MQYSTKMQGCQRVLSMARKTVVGVMGPGEGATLADLERAQTLGRLIAGEGWVLLTGGRRSGVMDAASKGAHGIRNCIRSGSCT